MMDRRREKNESEETTVEYASLGAAGPDGDLGLGVDPPGGARMPAPPRLPEHLPSLFAHEACCTLSRTGAVQMSGGRVVIQSEDCGHALFAYRWLEH